jgi:ribonuclease HI
MTRLLQTYSDGGARGNPGPAAIGVVLCDADGNVLDESSRLIGDRTNNQAEYEAMLLALTLAKQHQARRIKCHADSELIVYQLQGRYRIKDLALQALAEKVKSLAREFDEISFTQIPREHPMIARADKLLNKTLDQARAKGPDRSAGRGGPPTQKELF